MWPCMLWPGLPWLGQDVLESRRGLKEGQDRELGGAAGGLGVNMAACNDVVESGRKLTAQTSGTSRDIPPSS